MSNGTITMTGAEYDALAGKIASLEAELADSKARIATLELENLPLSMLRTSYQVHKALVEAAGCETIEQLAEQRDSAIAELAKLRTELGDGTTGNKYRAELYDEVWQKARDMGFGNVTNALSTLEVQRAEQWSLRREAEAKVDTQAAVIAELQADLAKLRAGQGVNQQLLEALEELIYAHTDKAEALATAAIAAARQECGKV